MPFTPKAGERSVTMRDRSIHITIGMTRKIALRDFARSHEMTVTQMVIQMVDYCMGDDIANDLEKEMQGE